MARSGFGMTLAVGAAVGVAVGTVVAIIVATSRNRDDAPETTIASAAVPARVAEPVATEAVVEAQRLHDEGNRRAAEAEQLNDDGTNAIKQADFDKARRLFKQAHDLVQSPRYSFNEALAYEAAQNDTEALNWLQIASDEHPDNRLLDKIKRRRVVIEKHKGSATK